MYTFFLWICFALLLIPGYLTFKNRNFNLDGKVNSQWSQFGIDEWLRIQNQLDCCGFFSPFVEAAISQVCYSRTVLPGCKGPYLTFERFVLERWYTIVFGLVPLQIGVIVVGLLCSNHITYRFGKGMMPKAYRLSMNSMAVIMDNYARYLCTYPSSSNQFLKYILVANWQSSMEQTLLVKHSGAHVRIRILTCLPPYPTRPAPR